VKSKAGARRGRDFTPTLLKAWDSHLIFVAYRFSSIYKFTFILKDTIYSFVLRFLPLDFCTTAVISDDISSSSLLTQLVSVFLGGSWVGLTSFDELNAASASSSKLLEVMIVWSGCGPLTQDGEAAAKPAVRQLDIVLLVERAEEFKEDTSYYRRIGVGIFDRNLVQLREVSSIRII
jgi:hypothetical protein